MKRDEGRRESEARESERQQTRPQGDPAADARKQDGRQENESSTSFCTPPTLHQLIWHVPVLIVQPEPLALCMRMLFFCSSKRRHVEPFELLGKQTEVFTPPL